MIPFNLQILEHVVFPRKKRKFSPMITAPTLKSGDLHHQYGASISPSSSIQIHQLTQ